MVDWSRGELLAAAKQWDGQNIPHWSPDWPMIGAAQRAGIVRVETHNRWMATVRMVPQKETTK